MLGTSFTSYTLFPHSAKLSAVAREEATMHADVTAAVLSMGFDPQQYTDAQKVWYCNLF
jgi:hypothetical protein